MNAQQTPHSALVDVFELAGLLQRLRSAEQEVSALLNSAIRYADSIGVPRHVIADGAGLSAGRITQIANAEGDGDPRPTELHRATVDWEEFSGDRLSAQPTSPKRKLRPETEWAAHEPETARYQVEGDSVRDTRTGARSVMKSNSSARIAARHLNRDQFTPDSFAWNFDEG